ncbi:MAG: CAAX prenyl protease-related protein [bacterium]
MALLLCKPWSYYPPLNISHFPLSATVGVGVFVLWVLPESSWARQWGGCYDIYFRFFVRQGGGGGGSMFAPEQCGWMYSSIRLAGSAFVIAVAEEFFWRGLLMRWMDKPIFLAVDPRRVGRLAFWITAMAFGAEHKQWFVGMLAGLAYGLLYVRKGDIWAAVTAHVITNYLLGLYVLATGTYIFW